VTHSLVSAKLAADLVLNARAATALVGAIESIDGVIARTHTTIKVNNVGQMLSVATMQAALRYKALNGLQTLSGDEFNMLMATALADKASHAGVIALLHRGAGMVVCSASTILGSSAHP
jgi:hypothetical protein